jgi:soluble lytic murein transglycosylase-like protein
MRPAFLIALALAALPARAELKTWVDKEGVFHVEGSSPDPGAAPHKHKAGRQAERPPADGSLPSWQRPNLPPRRGKKSTAGAPKAKRREAAKWWERRSDAPPDEIDHAAEVYKIPAELIRAVIAVESNGNAGAVSHKGALGLMQLMPGTAGEMYVSDPVDPAQNVLGGTRYLRALANQFGGDMLLMLAAYNAGPEAVRKYGGVPPFVETRDYVRRVMAYYYELKRRPPGKLADARGQGGLGVQP